MPVQLTVDFNNCDPKGRVRLSTAGTVRDLKRLGLTLKKNMPVLLVDSELSVDGVVMFNAREKMWVAKFDGGDLVNSAPKPPKPVARLRTAARSTRRPARP